jgi:carbonic anhydrase/acetyltransferase-like protein (isoleucine patch superfamily)
MKRIIVVALLCTVLCATAFAQNASDFTFNGGTITGYEGWDTDIVIPAQIGGVAVTAIGDGAFKNGGFTSVTLPASLRSIGNEAFSGNKLTAVTIPAGVSIGWGAFSGNQLTNLAIPAGVSISYSAFENNRLTSLTVGDGVNIGEGAFSNNQLTSLTVGNGVSIGERAFSNHRLASLTVGNGGSIASNAFIGNSLRNLVLGADIRIGLDTFSRDAYYDYLCNGSRAETYDNTVNYAEKTEGDYRFIETKYGVVITWYTGNEGSRLQIPGQLGRVAVKGIGSGAFNQKGVSRMQLPDGLVFIGIGSFQFNQLTSVTIPESVTYIGNEAFISNQLTSVTIPESVTYIGNEAFYDNPLTSVTIGNSVTIGESAFDFRYRGAGTYTRPDTSSLSRWSAQYR